MSTGRCWPRRSALLVGALGLSLLAPPMRAAASSAPTLRLLSATNRVTLHRFGPRVGLDLGVFAAASGGDFELRVSRPDYDSPVGIVQVDGQSEAVLRTLPADTLDDWRGLAGFTTVAFRNRDGEIVKRKRSTFCPNAYDRERVNDSGPERSGYPEFCNSHSPFQKGAVWGIDHGWATRLLGRRGSFMRVPNGHYLVRVRIASRYRQLLDIPATNASVRLHVKVKGRRRLPGPRPYPAKAGKGVADGPEAGVPTTTNPDPSTLPDLVALPAWRIVALHNRGRDLLAFAAMEWNAGPAPVEVEGFRRRGQERMRAFQYFYDQGGDVVGRARVGRLEYDDRRGHHHWHFRQFASYSLLDADQQLVVRSRKQSFCIAPTNAIDLTVPGADWQPYSIGLDSACGDAHSLWVREHLEAGWGDTYYQYIAGQSIDITRVPNGWYYLRVAVNPLGKLYETTAANDSELRMLRLRGRPGHRTVLVVPWHGIHA